MDNSQEAEKERYKELSIKDNLCYCCYKKIYKNFIIYGGSSAYYFTVTVKKHLNVCGARHQLDVDSKIWVFSEIRHIRRIHEVIKN